MATLPVSQQTLHTWRFKEAYAYFSQFSMFSLISKPTSIFLLTCSVATGYTCSHWLHQSREQMKLYLGRPSLSLHACQCCSDVAFGKITYKKRKRERLNSMKHPSQISPLEASVDKQQLHNCAPISEDLGQIPKPSLKGINHLHANSAGGCNERCIAKLGNEVLLFQLPVPAACFSGALLRAGSVSGTKQLGQPNPVNAQCQCSWGWFPAQAFSFHSSVAENLTSCCWDFNTQTVQPMNNLRCPARYEVTTSLPHHIYQTKKS